MPENRIEQLKKYDNCALWASYTVQENGHTIAYFTITERDATGVDLAEYQWTPFLSVSGGSIEQCQERVHAKDFDYILDQIDGAF